MLFTAKENVIKLYGNIYSGDGAWVSRQLEAIDGKYPTLAIHMHTNGGDVFEGNLIYNTLGALKSEVHVYIDGLVASMGTIMMLAASKIFIAANANIMTHAPSTAVRGTSKTFFKTAETLQGLETVFVDLYMAKTGKDKAYVEKWLDGDNFFNAKKALAEGLVDEIVTKVLPTKKINALKDMKIAAFYEAKDDSFSEDPELQSQQKQIQNSNTDPMKKELIEALGLQGVSAESSDTAIIAACKAKLEAEASKTNLEKKAKETLQAKLDTSAAEALVAVITTAEKDGQITAETKAHYEQIGKDSGIATLQAILSSMPKRESIFGKIHQSSGGSQPSATAKGWDEMQEKDSATLEAMSEAGHPQHETFKAMFKAKYNTDYNA